MKENILVVVDFQWDFVCPQGVLSVPGADGLVQNIQRLIESPTFEKVIYTMDTHTADEYETSAEKTLFPDIHCEFKGFGWDFFGVVPRSSLNFVRDVAKMKAPFTMWNEGKEIVFTKNVFDIWKGNAFFSPWIQEQFYDIKNTKITVCGVATNYCVFDAVMGFVDRGFEVSVPKRCVAGITHFPNGVIDESYETNIAIMKNRGVKFI